MNFRDPANFEADLVGLEDVERATARFVAQAVYEVLDVARVEFAKIDTTAQDVSDLANYLGEDLTKLALDRIGTSRVPEGRVFGAIDYKLAAYMFLPEFSIRQALFVDSKAEKGAMNNLRLQVTQTSLTVRQVRQGTEIEVVGRVPTVWNAEDHDYLTTTLFVKYHYADANDGLRLRQISVISLPNGFLQDMYNPTAADGIWNVGPDSPERDEKFRTRINFTLLEERASWRVQRMVPDQHWEFNE